MNKEEKKGYGIVIPAEWKASDFNGSLDDLFAQIVDLDIKAFYRMAESTDIDLELLKNAGYDLQALVDADIREHPQWYDIRQPVSSDAKSEAKRS